MISSGGVLTLLDTPCDRTKRSGLRRSAATCANELTMGLLRSVSGLVARGIVICGAFYRGFFIFCALENWRRARFRECLFVVGFGADGATGVVSWSGCRAWPGTTGWCGDRLSECWRGARCADCEDGVRGGRARAGPPGLDRAADWRMGCAAAESFWLDRMFWRRPMQRR